MSRVGGSFCVSVCSSGSTCLLLHQHLGCVCVSCSLLSGSLQPCGLQPTRLLCPWGSPGKNAGVGCMPSSRGSSPFRDRTHVSLAPAWQAASLPVSHQEISNQLHATSIAVALQEVLQLCSHTCSGYSGPFAFLYYISYL